MSEEEKRKDGQAQKYQIRAKLRPGAPNPDPPCGHGVDMKTMSPLPSPMRELVNEAMTKHYCNPLNSPDPEAHVSRQFAHADQVEQLLCGHVTSLRQASSQLFGYLLHSAMDAVLEIGYEDYGRTSRVPGRQGPLGRWLLSTRCEKQAKQERVVRGQRRLEGEQHGPGHGSLPRLDRPLHVPATGGAAAAGRYSVLQPAK